MTPDQKHRWIGAAVAAFPFVLLLIFMGLHILFLHLAFLEPRP